MNSSKRLLLLSFIPLFLNVIHLEASDWTLYFQKERPDLYQKFHEERLGKDKIHQLKQQMKSIRHRIGLYFKCVQGTATPEEQELIKETLSADGILCAGTLYYLGLGTWLIAQFGWPQCKKYYLERQWQKLLESFNINDQAKQNYDAAKIHLGQTIQTYGPNSPQADNAVEEFNTTVAIFYQAQRKRAAALLLNKERLRTEGQAIVKIISDPDAKSIAGTQLGLLEQKLKMAQKFLDNE